MKIVAKPIDVIATFSDNKKPIPYKFKFFRDSGDKIEAVSYTHLGLFRVCRKSGQYA